MKQQSLEINATIMLPQFDSISCVMIAKESAITLMLHVQCFVCSSSNLLPFLFFLFPSSSLQLLELASNITGKRILEIQ